MTTEIKGCEVKRIRYMHTLDGQPATFIDGEQICFAACRRPINLCASMDEIREQRKASSKWRRKKGWSNNLFHYGAVRVFV